MKKAMILLLSAICAMMMGIASPTPVQASSTDYGESRRGCLHIDTSWAVVL